MSAGSAAWGERLVLPSASLNEATAWHLTSFLGFLLRRDLRGVLWRLGELHSG